MTFEELRTLQISNIIASASEFKDLAKECLSIVSTSTLKDNEISMLIAAAVADMERNDIDVLHNLSDGLIQHTIIMYVKGHFGYGEDKEKQRVLVDYNNTLGELSLSSKYRLEEE